MIGVRLQALFGDGLNYKSLRRLLRNDSGPGVIRTILLWILGRWNADRPRICCKCGTSFHQQIHVVSCAGLTRSLLAIMPELDLSVLASPESIISAVLELSSAAQRALLPAIESLIRSAIGLVFGDRTPTL